MKNLITICMLISLINVKAQNIKKQTNQKLCKVNLDNKEYAKYLPKDFCIDNKFVINQVFLDRKINSDGFKESNLDFDNDSIKDFVFSFQKTKMKDGDTTYVSFYKVINGKATHFKTFNNLKPIYFKNMYDDKRKKDKFTTTYNLYDNHPPLREFEIKNDSIEITCYAGEANEYNELIYKFDKLKQDWFLVQTTRINIRLDTRDLYEDENLGKSISLFRYEIYLEN